MNYFANIEEILIKTQSNPKYLLELCINERLENNEEFYSLVLQLLREKKINAFNIGFSNINNLMNEEILKKYLGEIIKYPLNNAKEKIYNLLSQYISIKELLKMVNNKTISVQDFINIYKKIDNEHGYILECMRQRISMQNFNLIFKNIKLLDYNFLIQIIHNDNDAIRVLSSDIIINLCIEMEKHKDSKNAIAFAKQKFEGYENMLDQTLLPSFFRIYGNLINPSINCQLKWIDRNSSPEFLKNGKEKESQIRKNKILIFSDLMKAALDSNNQSLLKCANTLNKGDKIFYDIIMNKRNVNSLSEEEVELSNEYIRYLYALYELSPQRIIDSKNSTIFKIKKSENRREDIQENFQMFSERYHFKLANCGKKIEMSDMIIHLMMNGLEKKYFPEINKTSDIIDYMKRKQENSNARHKKIAEELKENKDIFVEPGDLIKGVTKGIFSNSIENGIRSSEYNAELKGGSNNTPLGSDMCVIFESDKFKDALEKTECQNYGNIFLILKYNSDKILYTRKDNVQGNLLPIDEEENDKKRLEAYNINGEQGLSHYCIRTAFGISDIDYIIIDQSKDEKENDNYLKTIKERLIKQGLYVPIVDYKTKSLLFEYNEFEKNIEKENEKEF